MLFLYPCGSEKRLVGLVLLLYFIAIPAVSAFSDQKTFDPEKDLLCLNYDHAPDKDDGHSAAADRTILTSMFGVDWIKAHVQATSGTYGENADKFNPNSDSVMDVAWNDCGGWLAAHGQWAKAVETLAKRWRTVLDAGGDVWVKEGGQSDITADVVKKIKKAMPKIDTQARIHVVQHSDWNERYTTDTALAYVKTETDYIRIPDANAYLKVEGGNDAFVVSSVTHPVFGKVWRAAFDYYDPADKIDFSDTGILMHILGLGQMDINAFRARFLDDRNGRASK